MSQHSLSPSRISASHGFARRVSARHVPANERGAVSRNAVIAAAVLLIGGAVVAQQLGLFKSLDAEQRIPPGDVDISTFSANRLKDLVVGVPEGSSEVGEARTAFAPDEKIILHGIWDPDPTVGAPVDWEWYSPDGSLIYQTSMEVKKEWRNSWSTYRGPRPLPAGDYTILLLERGRRLGGIGFKVVREESAIPVRAMARAFESSKLTAEHATALALGVRAVVAGEKSSQQIVEGLPQVVSDRKIGLALGLYQNNKQVLSKLGEGDTFGASVLSTLSAIPAVTGLVPAEVTIELSVLHSGLDISSGFGSVSAQLSGNTGMSLEVGDKRATLLPTNIFRMNLKEAVDVLRQISIDAGLKEDGYNASGAKLTAFKSQEFVLVPAATEVVEMLNGRAVVRPESLTWDTLLAAVDRTADWYVDNQESEGNYMYSFIPSRDEKPNDDWCLRVLNTVFVMAEIANARPDRPEIRASVERAVDLYAGSLKGDATKAYVRWTKPRHDWGLGSTAFLLGSMALLKRPGDGPNMKRMLNAILAEQEASGRYSTSFEGEDRDVDQQFYPGEGMLGLMRYYAATEDEAALQSVEKAFDYYKRYWEWEKNGPYVPWQNRSYMELHKFRPEQKYADYVFSMMDWMMKTMPPLPMSSGLAKGGAFERMFASTGVYTEGLVAAYLLAVRVGDKARTERYGHALVGCVRYVLGLQFKETDVYPFARPKKLLGALATKPRDNELRLDFTYHAMSAVNEITQSMTREQWDSLRATAFN